MFSSLFRDLAAHPERALLALTSPLSVWDSFRDSRIRKREQDRPRYAPEADPNWERNMTDLLGIKLPTQLRAEFGVMWPVLNAQNSPTESCAPSDEGFARAIWQIARHLRPVHVVETGATHGPIPRMLLEGMERNRAGHLWSVAATKLDCRTSENALAHRWSSVEGTNRKRLPSLLDRLGQINLFIHDGAGTDRNVRFALDNAWTVLKPGGAMIVNAIDTNWGFNAFVRTHRGFDMLICEAEPSWPDTSRAGGKSLFGIILKRPWADRL